MFLPVVYLAAYFAGDRARWCVLLAATLLFYAALNVPYLLVVLVLVTITTYCFGIWLDHACAPKAKYFLLWGGIATNVLILVIMKYLPFLSENLNTLSTLLSLDIHIQPVKTFIAIGVSFYVFQAISYLIDIYLEIAKPERHVGYFALYLAFFPKLLQGPIERASDLIPQLKTKYEFNYDNMRMGMVMFANGLFKKVVVADRLALYVNPVFDNVHAYSGPIFILATYLYAFQIYFDFAGYTDMALGSARIFNINLTQNFNSPYFATSIADFWRRWHISFSRWILDYIFKPLQLHWREWKTSGTAAALIVTFVISGVWHGASWGFIIWGLLHGIYLAVSVYYRPLQKKIHKCFMIDKSKTLRIWQTVITFQMVCFSWIFFRSNSIEDAFYIIAVLIRPAKSFHSLLMSQGILNIMILLIFIPVLFLLETKLKNTIATVSKFTYCRWTYYIILVQLILFFGVFSNTSKYIYYTF